MMARKKSPAKKPVEKKIEEKVEIRSVINPYDMPDKDKAFGASGNVVRWIQFQLDIEVTGEYDETTVKAVKAFQAAHALKETGAVDKLTRIVLADV